MIHLVCVGGEDHGLRIPFLQALQQPGLRISAVSPTNDGAFARAGIGHRQFEYDRFSNGTAELASLGRLRRLVLDLAPDVVQSFDTKPNLMVPLALRGTVPLVRTINGLGWVFSSSETRALMLRPVYFGLQRLVSRWTSAIVFQNREDEAVFRRFCLVGKSKALLISSSGIDVESFTRAHSASCPERIRKELGLKKERIVVFVGRLTNQKGLPTLLKVAPKVVGAYPDVRLVLVGPLQSEGPFAVDRTAIDGLAPHVIYVGPRSDVPAVLSAADVFVFPTQYREGVPRVLLEAGLARLPIVASRMPGCGDVVKDGWNGYLVDPRDAEGFAQRIVALLRDPERASVMGYRSFEFVRDNFEMSIVTGKYLDLYRDLVPTDI
jgi:glycosyltransferase involved in cell wall biosynthesis